MAQAGKIDNAILEMERLNIKIMGISEMRWPGASYCDIGKYRVYYSGTSDGSFQCGVGIIVSKSVADSVTNFIPVSERVMLLQIRTSPTPLNIIQVYAPTTDHPDEEMAEFYSQITMVLGQLPKQDENTPSFDSRSLLVPGFAAQALAAVTSMMAAFTGPERASCVYWFEKRHSVP
ncbi:craniofacial development protein 2-like [Nilaparvata lugens]|uniref:craniofacial development protein 2-like n=1 Tax=Nilaparvata lugens TaxID=108931 RepID=UPI00193CB378|nr:craniofacial development protein 2-like [Nilaparvata lugens]